MKRALAIVFAAAVVGGVAGAMIGIALDDGDAAASTTQAAQAAQSRQVLASSRPAAGSAQTPEEIYRNAAPAVVVITVGYLADSSRRARCCWPTPFAASSSRWERTRVRRTSRARHR
jgi:Na+/glutamate symporter